MKIRNPIIPGFYPDPSICRVGGDFYLVTSSFEYFPGVPIFHSRDLVNWEQIGHCLTSDIQLPLPDTHVSGGIFAPTIRHHNGVFYMVTTNTTKGGNFYIRATDPAGPWSDPVWVNHPNIDPDLFWDDDGTVYLTSAGILQSTIDIETGKRLTDVLELWTGTGGQYPEAPHLYKIGRFYYLMIAEGGTEYGHMVTIARSDSPRGPWTPCPSNPILTHRSSMSPIQATGHADMVEDQNGNWWMVCLGIRPVAHHPAHHLGRETFLTPVKWTDDGWPVVGNNGRIALEMDGHNGLVTDRNIPFAGHDDFDEDKLAMHWNFRGNPSPGTWSLTEQPGYLTLRCTPQSLDDQCGQAWLARRQQHFGMRASAEILFEPAAEYEEAGICVFQNIRHHYEVGITIRGGTKRVVVRRRIGSLVGEVASAPAPRGGVWLVIEADRKEYRLGLSTGDSRPVFLAQGEARYLSSEVGGRFTGVYTGMYATANGRTSGNRAAFNCFKYEVTGDM